MLAILFTNIAFATYLVYIALERKKLALKDKKFWLALLGLVASMYVAYYYLYLPHNGDMAP